MTDAPFGHRTIAPMKAAPGDLPEGADWAYEIKWDGMRIVAFIEDGAVRLQSTNLLNVTHRFPELEDLADCLGGLDGILDGEVVSTDQHGRPSFARLQERIHVASRAGAEAKAVENPVSFIAFDILHLDGHDTTALPYESRRSLLEQAVQEGPSWRITTAHRDGGAELLAVVVENELEGVVAKRLSSTYREGRRSPEWIKVKPRRRQEFVVGGWATGQGSRAEAVGSLIVGVFDDDGLFHFAGRVGSGLDGAELRRLGALFDDLARETSPFAGPIPPKPGRRFYWVEPEVVVEVAFAEWIDDHHLRHPSYLGQRLDVPATAVRREG